MAFAFDNVPPIPASMKQIMIEVCERHKTTPMDLASRSRTARVVYARREYVYRCRTELPHASYPRIARSINQDHTTAIHAMRVASADPDKMQPFKHSDGT